MTPLTIVMRLVLRSLRRQHGRFVEHGFDRTTRARLLRASKP